MRKNLQQDQRGVGHLLLIILAVVVVAGVGVAGWKTATKNKTTTKGSSNVSNSQKAATTSGSSADSNCLAAYHDATLCKFAENSTSFDKTAYTATITSVQSGASETLTLASDGKGNTKLTGSENGQEFSAVTLDGAEYIQTNGAGDWIEYPTGSTTPVSNPTSNMNIGVGSSGIAYKSLGTVACGNLTCYKYQVTDSATPSVTQYALFDTSSYKLRVWQYSDGSGNSATMDITYDAVNITKPSPVESLSSLSE